MTFSEAHDNLVDKGITQESGWAVNTLTGDTVLYLGLLEEHNTGNYSAVVRPYGQTELFLVCPYDLKKTRESS